MSYPVILKKCDRLYRPRVLSVNKLPYHIMQTVFVHITHSYNAPLHRVLIASIAVISR